MKKLLLIICALFSAFFAHAQGIVLEKVFNYSIYKVQVSSARDIDGNQILLGYPFDFDDCFFHAEGNMIKWWDENYMEHSINVGVTINDEAYLIAAKNIFSTDGLLCFFCPKEKIIINELGNIIYTFSELVDVQCDYGKVVYMFGEYKLIIGNGNSQEGSTYIYSLPGRGSSAISETHQESSYNRKYIKCNLVYIDSDTNTYDVRGAMVK